VSANRDTEGPHGPAPPTPPYIRVRIRRFGRLSAIRQAEPFEPPNRRLDSGRSSGPSRLHLDFHRRGTPFGVNCPSSPDTAAYTAAPSVRAFSRAFPAMRFMAVSALSGQCPNRAGRLPRPTTPSADFCPALRHLATPSVPIHRGTGQTSRGKSGILRCAPAGFTAHDA